MICHQIFSVAVCVELTEFLDITFKMPIFKPKFNFFKFLKPIRLSIPGGFWPCNFFPDILILRGQNHKIIGVKKLQAMTLQFEALGVLESKSWRKETPILNQKQNWGLFSLTFFYPSTPEASNCDPMSCDYFVREFSRFGLLQIKISDNNLWGHNPFGIVNRIVFLNVKKLNIGLHSVLCTVNSLMYVQHVVFLFNYQNYPSLNKSWV